MDVWRIRELDECEEEKYGGDQVVLSVVDTFL